MDKLQYRRKYYQENKVKLQAYQKWYYQKKKKEREVEEVKYIKQKRSEKPYFKKMYGDFTIHFE